MKVTVIGAPEVCPSPRSYKSTTARIKAQNALNLLALATSLELDKETTERGAELILDFNTNRFAYRSAVDSGYYELDGSSESLLQLINHKWLLSLLARDPVQIIIETCTTPLEIEKAINEGCKKDPAFRERVLAALDQIENEKV